ncbi:MAG: class II aldolase/adducin family protein [Candidatus Nitrosocaldus sp.]|nr:class II aldolase/adducin family protein [Candidatus Nitrosocaldus sp.]MCS7142077.1 class II aldolase/adducin family protein [Candidatus Nitrosocaldus sp.]MDW8000890.1 class II aldolase/adducin family protein [Candidatus Nitrosocaldus sp.]
MCRCSVGDEEYVKRELVSCVRTLFSKGYVSSGGGNHSVRLRDGIWITPSGYPRSHLTVDDLVLIDSRGCVLRGDLRPSIEVPFHTEIYRVRCDINAVSHAHSPYSHALIQTLELAEVDGHGGVFRLDDRVEQMLPLRIPDTLNLLILEYRQLGSRALARLVGEAFSMHANMVVLLDHGVIGVGKCIHEAMLYVQLLEEWARCVTVSLRMDISR